MKAANGYHQDLRLPASLPASPPPSSPAPRTRGQALGEGEGTGDVEPPGAARLHRQHALVQAGDHLRWRCRTVAVRSSHVKLWSVVWLVRRWAVMGIQQATAAPSSAHRPRPEPRCVLSHLARAHADVVGIGLLQAGVEDAALGRHGHVVERHLRVCVDADNAAVNAARPSWPRNAA